MKNISTEFINTEFIYDAVAEVSSLLRIGLEKEEILKMGFTYEEIEIANELFSFLGGPPKRKNMSSIVLQTA